jgi:hypothetical protein
MHLREPSPAPLSAVLSRDRSRSTSTKRKNSSDSHDNPVISIPPTPLLPPPDTDTDPSLREKSDLLTLNIAKVNSLVDTTLTNVAETSCDPAVITAINTLGEAVKLLVANQTVLANQAFSAPPAVPAQPWIPIINSYAAAANKKVVMMCLVLMSISPQIPTQWSPYPARAHYE